MAGGGPSGSGLPSPVRRRRKPQVRAEASVRTRPQASKPAPPPKRTVGPAIHQTAKRTKVPRFTPANPRQDRRSKAAGHNAKVILREGKGASQKQRLSALATALVEARLQNVKHGHADSLGVFQQRPSQGWGSPKQITNPSYAAKRYYKAARETDRPGLKPSQLAVEVQRPAKSTYPRYSKAVPAAKALEREIKRSGTLSSSTYRRAVRKVYS